MFSERPVDDREDRKLAAFLDDVDEADLEAVQLLGDVHKAEHETVGVSSRVHKAPFEAVEGALLHVDAPELDTPEVGFAVVDESPLEPPGNARGGVVDESQVDVLHGRIL